MILNLIALNSASKVWIYQADKEFSDDELDTAREDLFHFLNEWTAHSKELVCYGNIFHRRFLAFFVDESGAYASGCSIDKSVKFVEYLGNKFGKDFFDRMTYAYLMDEEISTVHHAELANAYASKKIDDETLFFDNLVRTKEDFLSNWIKPLKSSWHSKFL
jgi:hypothetical protein